VSGLSCCGLKALRDFNRHPINGCRLKPKLQQFGVPDKPELLNDSRLLAGRRRNGLSIRLNARSAESFAMKAHVSMGFDIRAAISSVLTLNLVSLCGPNDAI
jgi:hypothetical protein